MIKKSFSEWFDPENIEHIKAYYHLQRRGFWPENFIPDNVYMEPNWKEILNLILSDRYIKQVLHNT